MPRRNATPPPHFPPHSPSLETQLAYRIETLVAVSGIGRSQIYQEIRTGRLQAVKSGRSTLVLADDAKTWLRALPKYQPASYSASAPRMSQAKLHGEDK